MAQEAPQQRVLVADDTDFFRTMLTHVLSDEGYEVETAEDGSSALEMLERQPQQYRLLVADLLMPGLNGFQLIERLRKNPALEQLPVLVLTQYCLNELERGILRSHQAGTLSKTASLGQILFAVAATLNPDDDEARRHLRAAVSLPLTVRVGGKVHISHCFNLSEDGLFVILPDSEAPEMGADVVVRFWVPEAAEVLEVNARVVWINRVGSLKRTHPPGFGVQLTDPDPRAVDALQKYLDAS